jgi:DNA-directed RNA polymerase
MELVEEHNIPLDKIDRKVAKKVVMLIPYGGTYDTLHGHVKDATKEWELEFKETHYLTKAMILGMQEAVPGFAALNSWFKQAAKEAMDAEKDYVVWRTAAGSEIVQYYREPLLQQAKTFVVNSSRYRIQKVKSRRHKAKVLDVKDYHNHLDRIDHPSIIVGYGDVLKRKNQTALAANWTHSQDAATLQLAFAQFDLPFSTVHDCVYAPAPVILEAVRCVREAFVSVVTWDALQEFIRLNELTLSLPPMGNADVTTALESDYLFS